MATLRIGILGAARIADEGIVGPARALGHELVAIAARDRRRAEAFAAKHGVRRVHDTYADVLSEPDVDLVYNALVNSLHAEWNIAAVQAGKHVLSEKPLSRNAADARKVQEVAVRSGKQVVEGFHYLHHPIHVRLRELVSSGRLGQIQRVELTLATPSPPDTDPRWSLALAGGATMDLGCYVLNAARHLGRWVSGQPKIVSVGATLKAPEIDAAMRVELVYPGGITATAHWDMSADDRTMTWTVIGSEGAATSPAFAVPHLDPRLILTRAGQTIEERLGGQTSYTYQLANLATTLAGGQSFLVDVHDTVANAELIDECYRRAGMTPRGSYRNRWSASSASYNICHPRLQRPPSDTGESAPDRL